MYDSGLKSYLAWFQEVIRPDPRPDLSTSDTLTPRELPKEADITTTVIYQATSDLKYALSENPTAELNLGFVQGVLAAFGPMVKPSNMNNWTLEDWPPGVPKTVTREEMYYSYLSWVIYWSAAHAMRVVIDQIYAAASQDEHWCYCTDYMMADDGG
ncbi:hypothetical protein K438DRAFT_1964230 [Mycena galopus ATCC 62051]|nr:hypothetical protein K438DRAFT_1964230 [Mycena galopus ATCC 62051]